MPWEAQCLDHVAIGVRSLAASRRWYQRVLGMTDFMTEEPTFVGEDLAFMRSGGAYLALMRLAGDRAPLSIANLGPVQCSVAKAFGDWARFGVDRAARQILGSPVAKIETMGSYNCRNVAGTEVRSAHARAEAIDVAAFVLADGRRIVLKRDWQGGDAATREFLRVVHKSACKRFGTVLGPEYNAAHQDHFHLEGTGAKFCR